MRSTKALTFFLLCLQFFSCCSAQFLRNLGTVKFRRIPRNASEIEIDCVYSKPDREPEIFLFQNRTLISTSKDEVHYNVSTGFRVKLPEEIPLRGISYECRVFELQQRSTLRILPDTRTYSTPFDQVGVLINDTVKLQCTTGVEKWMPLKVIHNFTDLPNCQATRNSVACDIKATDESNGHYYCVQSANTNNVFKTQIISRWTVTTIPERVHVKLTTPESSVFCESKTPGATRHLESCPCKDEKTCGALLGKFNQTNPCDSSANDAICDVTPLNETTVPRDPVDFRIYRCYVIIGNDRANCNQFSLVVEPLADNTQLLVIIIVVVSLLLLLAVALIVVYRQKFLIQKIKVQHLTKEEIDEFRYGNMDAIDNNIEINDQAHLLPYKRELEFPKSSLHFEKQLGAGAYGTVMRARAEGLFDSEGKSVLTVAVKTIPPSAEHEYFRALLMELKIMSHIGKHVNVLGLLGAVTENLERREIYMIVEFCQFGDLQSYLQKNADRFVNQLEKGKINPRIIKNTPHDYGNVPQSRPQVSLGTKGNVYMNVNPVAKTVDYGNVEPELPDSDLFSTTTLVNWCYQIAKGMEFLDSKKVMHGDLAARNVLIADKFVAKIADFGLARQIYSNPEYQKTQRQKLPIKWMALESLTKLVFSTKSDVWAYGITLHEMFTLGETPYPGTDIGESFLKQLQQGYRMKQAKLCPTEIYKVMISCWEELPENRPSFQDLGTEFGRMLSQLDDHYTRVSKVFED